jgi:hypothetical protein
MEWLLKALSVFALSMIKFPFSQVTATGLGFGFLPTFLITTAGGCTGVIIFYHASGWLLDRARRRRIRRMAEGHAPKRSFSRTNRTIVRVKRSQGLSGLAFLTPILISVPIGSVLAAKYFRNDKRTLPVLLISVVAWGIVLTSFWQFFK